LRNEGIHNIVTVPLGVESLRENNGDWKCLKYCIFTCFCTVIVRCTETFWSPCIILSFVSVIVWINPLNAELNPICHLLALLGGATIVVVSRLRVNNELWSSCVHRQKDWIISFKSSLGYEDSIANICLIIPFVYLLTV
jgi:hypothetical protein